MAGPVEKHWLDRAIETVSPSWALRRHRQRFALRMMKRHYEAAAVGRRTQGWHRSLLDANAANGPSLAKLRDIARDLVRNNGHAKSALDTIANHTVGWGIVPAVKHEAFRQWSESTQCDADGRDNLAGLQHLVTRALAQDGEVLVRRRYRLASDGLALPLQLQVLEADHLDISKDGVLSNGNRCIQGVEFDLIGRRVAYWLFRDHPGASNSSSSSLLLSGSVRVPAFDITHVYEKTRPGQARGVSWFSPVLLRFKDFDEFEDATLMKQKIAACLAVLMTDTTGGGEPLGTEDEDDETIDSIEPGMIKVMPPGMDVKVVNPPTVGEYADYSKTSLRAIATGLGVSYEDLTGDYTNLPFSAARMSRMRHWARVTNWRYRILIPAFLNPVWQWAQEASMLVGAPVVPETEWTAPALPMIDPDKEVLSLVRQVRSGLTTFSDALRERGYNVETFMAELAADFEKLEKLGLVLDIDPRVTTQAGQLQGAAAPKAPAPAANPDDEDDDGEDDPPDTEEDSEAEA